MLMLQALNSVREPMTVCKCVCVCVCVCVCSCDCDPPTHQGGSAEVELKTGDTLTLSTEEKYKEIGDSKCVYIDYYNICKVIPSPLTFSCQLLHFTHVYSC